MSSYSDGLNKPPCTFMMEHRLQGLCGANYANDDDDDDDTRVGRYVWESSVQKMNAWLLWLAVAMVIGHVHRVTSQQGEYDQFSGSTSQLSKLQSVALATRC